MICYRDMTFCQEWERCKKGKSCERRFTKKDDKKAKKLGFGVCWGSFDCFVKKEKRRKNI